MLKAVVTALCMVVIVMLSRGTGTDAARMKSPHPKESLPIWLAVKIARFKAEPVTNPPRQVFRYKYNKADVYYVPPICCDQYGIVYSGKGDTLCYPDGGFTGRGDGRCGDFFETATDSSLIWKDNRKR